MSNLFVAGVLALAGLFLILLAVAAGEPPVRRIFVGAAPLWLIAGVLGAGVSTCSGILATCGWRRLVQACR